MAQPEALRGQYSARRWAALVGSDNRLVRAVAGAPADVRTKLLVAFLGIAGLLVLVGVVGLRFLAQANARVEGLGTLQARSTTYDELQTQASMLRQLLGFRNGGDPGPATVTGAKSSFGGRRWALVDGAIRFGLSELGPSTSEADYSFVPPAGDERMLERIRLDYHRFDDAMTTVASLDGAGVTSKRSRPALGEAVNADQDLFLATNDLAERIGNETDSLIAANRSAYTSSRNLFVAVGAISVALAVGLGLILSWSLIGPIQSTESRLSEIAAGDFSGRLHVPNRDELGSLAANVNRMNDELRRLYGELETASRHKSEFLANMSHELRTPLNAIIGFSQLLRKQLFGPINAKQDEYLDDILSSGHHLLSLINDVLDLSKVEAGQVQLELDVFSLREALERGVVMVRERATGNDVKLSVAMEPEFDVVRGDERRIRQVVFNLLSNAVKFTPPGGEVAVAAARIDGEVQVSVTDSGPGIALEDQERIFEEFQQTEAGVEHREGTGLGLALSRRLVELHGGRIWVESEPGRGSRFVFALPDGEVSHGG
ncbi:MAG TPA: HAMP domain-containing sensor histidine kinase [Gaiellaceae bacterium]|jgi:signal transduction histidine kinase|nr:HAMP domain-containing sensor histidine kinase [Gaiellaceae bacterium]